MRSSSGLVPVELGHRGVSQTVSNFILLRYGKCKTAISLKDCLSDFVTVLLGLHEALKLSMYLTTLDFREIL